MVPHPLIHLQLARLRHDQLLTAGQRRSRFDLDAHREEQRRSERGTEVGARACARFARRLVGHAREPRSGVQTHFAHREADGITVDLYWTHGEHGDAFRVDVIDHRNETTFTLHPATGKQAVAAYHHPFAMTSPGRVHDVAA
jgi:hypothetical protein